MEEENPILKHWQQQSKIFTDNLVISRKKPTKDSVHDLRVAIKRMRSYLRLKKEIIEEEWKDSFATIAVLFKSFGRLRDFDMSIALLKRCESKEFLHLNFFKDYLLVNKSLIHKWPKKEAIQFNLQELDPFRQQFISLQNQLSGAMIYERIIFLSEKKIREVKELSVQFHSNVHKIRKILKDVYYWMQICPKEMSGKFIDLTALDKTLNYLGSWQDNFIFRKKISLYIKDVGQEEEKKSLKEFKKKLQIENKELLNKAQQKWNQVQSFKGK